MRLGSRAGALTLTVVVVGLTVISGFRSGWLQSIAATLVALPLTILIVAALHWPPRRRTQPRP